MALSLMELMQQIAETAADDAVQRYGKELGKAKQLTMWRRFYDTALASMIALDDIQRAHRVKTMAMISEN